MPKVKPYVGPIPHGLIGFHRARALKGPSDAFVHFYLYDKNFNCIKNDPTRYLSVFSKHPGVIAPDFSVYADMPKPLVMANSFYNKEIATILQQHGIAVIPNISWSRSWSYEFCFEGWPIGINCRLEGLL